MKKILFITTLSLLGTFLLNAQEISLVYDHTSLSVKDLNTSANFYKEILQLKEIPRPNNNPILRWFSLGGNHQLHLIQVLDSEIKTDKAIHFSLNVDNIESFVDYLNSKQVTYWDWLGERDKIATRPDGVRQVYIQDPEGYWIEINDAKYKD